MIEKALYSCENEITIRNLEYEQANGVDKSTEPLHKHIVRNFIFELFYSKIFKK